LEQFFEWRETAQQHQLPGKLGVGGFRSAALRSISLSCRTGNRPQSAPACSFLRYRQYSVVTWNIFGSGQFFSFDSFSGFWEFLVSTGF
jgi:hypothetical protein